MVHHFRSCCRPRGFTFRNLPAGSYRIAAVDDVLPGRSFDAAFLRPLVDRSTFVALAAGDKKIQNVTVPR